MAAAYISLKVLSCFSTHIYVVKCIHAQKCCSIVQFFLLSKLSVSTGLTTLVFSVTSVQTKNSLIYHVKIPKFDLNILYRLRAVPIFALEFVAPVFAMSFRGSTNSRGKIGTARSLHSVFIQFYL